MEKGNSNQQCNKLIISKDADKMLEGKVKNMFAYFTTVCFLNSFTKEL